MRRAVVIVVVFLLFGAIVNVGVAWGCIFVRNRHTMTGFMEVELGPIEKEIAAGCRRTTVECWRWSPDTHDAAIEWLYHVMEPSEIEVAVPLTRTMTSAHPFSSLPGYGIPTPGALTNAVFIETAGWPVLSMTGAAIGPEEQNGRFDGPDRLSWALSIPQTNPRRWLTEQPQQQWLPLRPVWPGFAINTILYGALLWLLFLAPFQWRRLIRNVAGDAPRAAIQPGIRRAAPNAAGS